MSRVLQNLLGRISFCYIDDLVVFSNNEEDHLNDLRQVLERLQSANLTLKLEKCSFFKTEIKYLGYNIKNKGISYENSFKLQNCPRPVDVKTLQLLLGLANLF